MPDSARPNDDVDLAAMAAVLLRGWKILLACLVAAVAAAFLWVHYAPKVYTTRMVVVSVQADGRPAAATATNVRFNLYLQSLRTHGLAETLAANRGAVEALQMHANAQGRSPSSAQVQRFLTRNLNIEREPKASTATLTLTVTNRDSGVKLLAILHRAANDYVSAKLDGPANAGPPGSAPHAAAAVFDGPYASDAPQSPRLRTVLRDAVIAGLLAGIALVWLVHMLSAWLRRRRSAAK